MLFYFIGHRSSTGAHLHLGRTGSKNPMNVNVCYDRYGKKSSMETGSTNKKSTKKWNDENDKTNERQSICDALKSSSTKGNSVRSKSDLNRSNLKLLSRGSSHDEMAVNKTHSVTKARMLPRSASNIPLVIPSKHKTNIRSKSDLWSVKKSCIPSMATVPETIVSNGAKPPATNIPSRKTINGSPSCDNLNPRLSSRSSKSNDTKSSKIPVSPTFQRKLKSNTNQIHSSHESKTRLSLNNQNKACEKPINRTQSAYMIQRKSDQKQNICYGSNKERS